MLKGIGKQVVVLKNTESEIFEEAIFILRESNSISKKDLLKECEEIINKNLLKNTFKTNALGNKFVKLSLVGIMVLLVICSTLLGINLL